MPLGFLNKTLQYDPMSSVVLSPDELSESLGAPPRIPTFLEIAQMFRVEAGKATTCGERDDALAWANLMLACADLYD